MELKSANLSEYFVVMHRLQRAALFTKWTQLECSHSGIQSEEIVKT